jgi:hypothetical protein
VGGQTNAWHGSRRLSATEKFSTLKSKNNKPVTTMSNNASRYSRKPRRKHDGICRIWESPLEGKKLPKDWREMPFRERVSFLVAVHWAHDFEDAASMLGKHGAAFQRMKKRQRLAREGGGGQKPEAGGQKPEGGSQRPEGGSQRPDIEQGGPF